MRVFMMYTISTLAMAKKIVRITWKCSDRNNRASERSRMSHHINNNNIAPQLFNICKQTLFIIIMMMFSKDQRNQNASLPLFGPQVPC